MPRYPKLFLFLKNWVFLPLVVLCLPLLVLLGQEVTTDLRLLRSADTDTVQWTLSQVEIEFLDFQLTLERNTDPEQSDLTAVRKDFDILYSRVGILKDGRLFKATRELEGFLKSITQIQDFLDQSTEVIDGTDDVLQAAIPDLLDSTNALRPQVRNLFIQGLEQFARQSDEQRSRIFTTLTELAIVSLTVLVALGVLILYSGIANAQIRGRGRALARANAYMQTLLSTTQEAIIVSDEKGNIVDLNAAAETTFGFSLADVKGQNIGDLIVSPKQRQSHHDGVARMIRTGKKRLVGKGRVQLEAMRANGDLFPVELALQSTKGDDGELIIGFIRDISQQRDTETQLLAARDQALAGEQAKADFLAVMSHEIRTPLNGLLGNLTLIGQSKLDRNQTAFVQNMEISGRQLMQHVNSVLDIAKFESGKTSVTHTVFHLGQFLQEIVDAQSGNAGRNHTSIEWAWLGAGLAWVKADQSILEQILLNLVGNAIKFTDAGRVSIEVERVTPNDSECTVEFRIIDTGIGISEEDQTRIFDDFETGDTTYTRNNGGTGLGLGIARRMVTLLNGEIGVESTLGEGSVFWVRLPFVPATKPQNANAEDETCALDLSLSILVAEDIETNAFVARRLLEKDGHRVTMARDGISAVSRATTEVFDVILMDISMPKMDGLQATQEIRKAPPPFCNVPILAFSANVLPAETDRFLANGMDGFLGKPLLIPEVRRALRAVADNTQATSPVPRPADAIPDTARDLLDQSEYDTFLRRFIAEGDTLMAMLTLNTLDKLGFDVVAAQSHQIRSTANLFGALGFATCLSHLEAAAKQADAPACLLEIARLPAIWSTDREKLNPEKSAAPVAE